MRETEKRKKPKPPPPVDGERARFRKLFPRVQRVTPVSFELAIELATHDCCRRFFCHSDHIGPRLEVVK